MRKELGQYMTPIEVVDFMVSLVEDGRVRVCKGWEQ